MIAGAFSPHAQHRIAGWMEPSPSAGETALEVGPLRLIYDDQVERGSHGRVSCFVHGRLFEGDRLASRFGVAPGTAADVLAQAYPMVGSALLERLRGSFVIALWDEDQGQGLIAADQLTTQALFVANRGAAFAFGEEARPLLRMLPTSPGPDTGSVAYWLAARTTSGDRTLYDGVRRLGPGCYLKFTRDEWEDATYWAPAPDGYLKASREELAGMLRSGLDQAVSRRLGRPAGVLLSGGLDSSVVATVAAGLHPDPSGLSTYSAVFPGQPDYDESDRIDALVDALRVSARRFMFGRSGAAASGLEYQRQWGVPMMAVGGFLEHALARAAAGQGVEVLLDGQGGDELFGEARYAIADRLRAGRLVSALRLARSVPGLGQAPSRRDIAWALRLYGLKGLPSYRLTEWIRGRGASERFSPAWLTPAARRDHAARNDPWAWKKGGGPRAWAEIKHSLIDAPQDEGRMDYFRRRGAMHGIQADSPLYDVDLIELALRIPPEEGFDPVLTRTLVREAMGDEMPEAVRLQNRKANFTRFYHDVLRGDFPVMREVLTDPGAEILAFVDAQWLNKHLDRRPKTWPSQGSWTVSTWGFFAMECWLRGLDDPSFPDRLLARPDVGRSECVPA